MSHTFRFVVAVACGVLVLAVLSACQPAATPHTATPRPSQSEFVLTFTSTHCEVSGPGINRREMPCSRVLDYVVDDLKLSTDALFEVTTIPDVDTAEFDRTIASLKNAGFRMTPGIHVNFLTEPKLG